MHTTTPNPNLNDHVRALRWHADGLEVLDQRRLPDTIEYQLCRSAGEVATAIRSMRVRGAPAIGIAAAYGVVLAARARYRANPATWRRTIEADFTELAGARPTAVNLFWALEQMRAGCRELALDPQPQLLALAQRIHADDIAANRRMGELGAALVAGAAGVLTHCNTGSLATGGFGTALGVIRAAYRHGTVRVFATETRPWLQGARLTVWELEQDGIPATLIADSAAGYLLKSGQIDWVIVGADRIAANGDVANKIGTYALAVLARQHGVKFMVVAPTSTIDRTIESGAQIEIEERAPAELLPRYYCHENSLIGAWNPVFDVTPADLIDALVTEVGVVERPTSATMNALFAT